MRKLLLASALVDGIFSAINFTIFVVAPIGALPEGRTVILWRNSAALNFIDSADAICDCTMGGVSAMSRNDVRYNRQSESDFIASAISDTLYSMSRGQEMGPIRAVQRSIQLSETGVSPRRNSWAKHASRPRSPDSGAAKSLNLCRATKSPAGCHAIVRSVPRRAQRDPRPAPGRGQALQAALCSAVLDPCRGHRRQFLPLHRDLHQGAPPPAERRLRSALAACARPYRYSLHPSGPRSTGGRAGVPPPRRWSARRRNRSGAAIIALDGKTLRRSFDNFNDRKAAQVLHAFDVEAGLVLAHVDIEEKSNEIPAAQQLLGELKVAHCIVTLDAMHCQKKPSRPPHRRRLASSSN